MAPGLSAPPLMLCLDLRMHTPDESEGIGSLCGNTDNSKSQGDAGSLRANTDDSEIQGAGSPRANTDDSEGRSLHDTLDNAESQATSRHMGSLNWDWEEGSYSLEWANLDKFQLWRLIDEHLSCIQFVMSSTWTGDCYSQWQCFVCGRQESGGEKIYEKQHLDRERKSEMKKTGCGCHIDIKQYPHTSTVLGCYVAEHDHEIGAANIAYTCLSGATQE